MKLYKNYQHFQILHLYEHVLAATFFREMYQLKRWEYLDFYFNARTFSTGLLLVELHKYRRFKFDFKELKLNLSDEIINQAKQLIFTEKQVKPIAFNNHKIRQELSQIHRLPWHQASNFELDDVDESANFFIEERTISASFAYFKQTFNQLSPKHHPAIKEFIGYFNVNFATFLAQQAGLYPAETIDQPDSVIEKFSIPTQINFDLNILLADFCQNFMNKQNLDVFYQAIIQEKYQLNPTEFKSLVNKIKIDFSRA
mgnify:FL=1